MSSKCPGPTALISCSGSWGLDLCSVDLHCPGPRLGESVTFQDTHPPGLGPGAGDLVWGGWGGAQLRRLTPEVGSVSARKELITPDDISCHRRSLNKWVTLDQAPGTFGRISTSHPHSVTAWRCFFPSWGHILANCFCLIGWHKTCVQYPVFLVMLPLLCLDAFSARTHYLILIEGWKKEVRKQEPSLFLPPKAHLYPHLTFYRSVCPAGKGLVPEGWWFPESSLK